MKNLNVPASVCHTKDGKEYRFAGLITSINESTNTCSMSFNRNGKVVTKNNIPLDSLVLNEGLWDSIKDAAKWSKNKIGKALDIVCKKVGRFIVAIVDGIKMDLKGMPINAYEATKNSKAINVFPSAHVVANANASGLTVDINADEDAVTAQCVDEEEDVAEIRTFWERVREAFVGTVDEPAPEERTLEEAIDIVYTKYYPQNTLFEANGIAYKNHRVLNEATDYAESAYHKSGITKIIALESLNGFKNVNRAQLIELLKSNISAQIEGNILFPDGLNYYTIDQYKDLAKQEEYNRTYMKTLPDGTKKRVFRKAGSNKSIDWDDYVAEREFAGGFYKTRLENFEGVEVEVPEDFRIDDEDEPVDPATGKWRSNYEVRLNDNDELEFMPNEKCVGQRKIIRARTSPLCIWGAPGIGKTSILKTAASLYSNSYFERSNGSIKKQLSFISLAGGHITDEDLNMILPREKTVGKSGSGDIKLNIAINSPNSVLPIYPIPSYEEDPTPGHQKWSIIDNLYNGGEWVNAVDKDYNNYVYDEDGNQIVDKLTNKPVTKIGYNMVFKEKGKAAPQNHFKNKVKGFWAGLRKNRDARNESLNAAYNNALNEAATKKPIKYFADDSEVKLRRDYPDIWNATKQKWYAAYLSSTKASPYAPALANIIALGLKAAWGRYRVEHNDEDVNKAFKKFWRTYTADNSLSAHLGTHNDQDNNRKSPLNTNPGPNGEASEARKYIENASGSLNITAQPAPVVVEEPEEVEVIEEPTVITPEPEERLERTIRKDAKPTTTGAPNEIDVNDGGILFIDEYSRMSTGVKRAIMTLFSDQEISGNVLASKWAIIAASNRVEELNQTDRDRFQNEVAFTDRVTQVNFVPTKEEFLDYASGTIKDKNGSDTGLSRLPKDLIELIEFFTPGAWYYCVAYGSWDYALNKGETEMNKKYHDFMIAGKTDDKSVLKSNNPFSSDRLLGLNIKFLVDEEYRKLRQSQGKMDLELSDNFDKKALFQLALDDESIVQAGGSTKSATSRTWEAIGLEYYQKLFELGISDAYRVLKPNTKSIDLTPPQVFETVNPEENSLGMDPQAYEQMLLWKYTGKYGIEDRYVAFWKGLEADAYRKFGNRAEGAMNNSVVQEYEALEPWSLKSPTGGFKGNPMITPTRIKEQCCKLWLIYSLIPQHLGVDTLAPFEANDFYQNHNMFTQQSLVNFIRTGGIGMKESLDIDDLGYFYDPSGQFANYTGTAFFGQYPHLLWKTDGNKIIDYYKKLINGLFSNFTQDVDNCVRVYMKCKRDWEKSKASNVVTEPVENKNVRSRAYDNFMETGQANTEDEDNMNPSFTGQMVVNDKGQKSKRPGAVQDILDSEVSSGKVGVVTADDFWIPEYTIDDFNRFVHFCALTFKFVYVTNPKTALDFIALSNEDKTADEKGAPTFTESKDTQVVDLPIFLPEDEGGVDVLKKDELTGDLTAIENPWPYLTSSDVCRTLIEEELAKNPNLVVNKRSESDNVAQDDITTARYIFAIVNFANMVYLFKNNDVFFIKCIRTIMEIARTSAFMGKTPYDNIALVFSEGNEGMLFNKYSGGNLRDAFKNCDNCLDPLNFFIYFGTNAAKLCSQYFYDSSTINPNLLDLWKADFSKNYPKVYKDYLAATGFDPQNPVSVVNR